MTAPFPIEVLGPQHDRKTFACGVEALDRYFREQATQDVRRRATACHVAIEAATARVAGFHTLAAGSVPLNEMPEGLARRLPRYPVVPVARLGRLAVAAAFQGRRLGAMLLWDAALRAARSELGVVALVVDAKDAKAFYERHGFMTFGGSPRQLMFSLVNFPPKT